MRRLLVLLSIAFLVMHTAIAQQVHPTKTVGVVLVVPPTGHLSRDGWFVEKTCDFFDLKEMNLYGAAFEGARSALASRYRLVRVAVPPGAAIRTRNTEIFGAFKLFPPVGEQVRHFARPDEPDDLYLVIWSSLSANTCELHPNMPVGYGIGLSKTGSGPTHLHTFFDAFLIDARTLQTSRFVYLQSAFVQLESFEWRANRAQLTNQQWQTIKTLMPKVLSSAAPRASRDLFEAH